MFENKTKQSLVADESDVHFQGDHGHPYPESFELTKVKVSLAKEEQSKYKNSKCMFENKSWKSLITNKSNVCLQGNPYRIAPKSFQFTEQAVPKVNSCTANRQSCNLKAVLKLPLKNIVDLTLESRNKSTFNSIPFIEIHDSPVKEEKSEEINVECKQYIFDNRRKRSLDPNESDVHFQRYHYTDPKSLKFTETKDFAPTSLQFAQIDQSLLENRTERFTATESDIHFQGTHHQIGPKCIQFMEIRDSPVKTEQSEQIMLEPQEKKLRLVQMDSTNFEQESEVKFKCNQFICESKAQEGLTVNELDVHFQGNRRHIDPKVFDNVQPKKKDYVLAAINGICIYEVPSKANGSLSHCKGGKPWERWISSTKGSNRLISNCKGSYICLNPSCANNFDFDPNRREFPSRKNQIVCETCGEGAIYIECEGRLIAEKKLAGKIIVKHYGIHTCPAVIKGRPEKQVQDVESMLQNFPGLTGEMLIRQTVQSRVEKGDLEGAKIVAKQLTNRKYLSNIKQKVKASRRLYGHSFNALEKLRKNMTVKTLF